MKATLYNLLANPESLRKLYQELQDADKQSGLSRPYPKWNEVKDLPYLHACFYEALRLHPPFVLPLERVVPKGGVVISDRYFPEGTCIGMNAYVVNRHRPTFGEDVESWRPERWLVGDPLLQKNLEGCIMTVSSTHSREQLKEELSSFFILPTSMTLSTVPFVKILANKRSVVRCRKTNVYRKAHRNARGQETCSCSYSQL
jgi:hypothetical protein